MTRSTQDRVARTQDIPVHPPGHQERYVHPGPVPHHGAGAVVGQSYPLPRPGAGGRAELSRFLTQDQELAVGQSYPGSGAGAGGRTELPGLRSRRLVYGR